MPGMMESTGSLTLIIGEAETMPDGKTYFRLNSRSIGGWDHIRYNENDSCFYTCDAPGSTDTPSFNFRDLIPGVIHTDSLNESTVFERQCERVLSPFSGDSLLQVSFRNIATSMNYQINFLEGVGPVLEGYDEMGYSWRSLKESLCDGSYCIRRENLEQKYQEFARYFPLHVGDIRQYAAKNTGPDSLTNPLCYTTYRISGDTLMPNNHSYFIRENVSDGSRRYFRIDTTDAVVYQYDINAIPEMEARLYKLGTTNFDASNEFPGPNCSLYTLFHSNDSTLLLQMNGVISQQLTFRKDIGLINTALQGGSDSDEWFVAAVIDNVEWGRFGDPLALTPETTPECFILKQNYPNPFNPVTRIRYILPERADVRFSIFDISGREIRAWTERQQAAGSYDLIWDATNQAGQKVAGGIYVYQLRAGSASLTQKMVFLK